MKTPEQHEVREYFFSIGGMIENADHFYDHFLSNGWRVSGKAPMKDWKAAARNWMRTDRKINGIKNRSSAFDLSQARPGESMEEFETRMRQTRHH